MHVYLGVHNFSPSIYARCHACAGNGEGESFQLDMYFMRIFSAVQLVCDIDMLIYVAVSFTHLTLRSF